MSHRIAGLLVALVLLCGAGSALAAPRTASEPSLTVPAARMQQALHCKGDLVGARRDPVLLVPGTFGWGAINWGWNYQKLLPTRGWPACTIDLPQNGAGDIQVASQYVVHAIRWMATRGGRKVAVIGHSQGGLEARWALRWWPDLRPLVSDLITLAAPNHGALYTNLNCNKPGSCAASLYQMRTSSAFLGALNRGRLGAAPPGIPDTAISTADDTVFVTPPEARLAGAVNIRVQDLCPAHHVDHVSLAFDGPAFAIVFDALTHPGPARLSRINRAACQTDTMPGVTRAEANRELAIYQVILAKALSPTGPRARREPALQCYVTGRCGRSH
jgi:pimeloyl-ACP methyl ester carboxylesterase